VSLSLEPIEDVDADDTPLAKNLVDWPLLSINLLFPLFTSPPPKINLDLDIVGAVEFTVLTVVDVDSPRLIEPLLSDVSLPFLSLFALDRKEYVFSASSDSSERCEGERALKSSLALGPLAGSNFMRKWDIATYAFSACLSCLLKNMEIL
jgi:hypothetical protein